MNQPAIQVSHELDRCARAIAEWTVDRHVELDPSLPERYGPGWRAGWVAEVSSRVRELAQAVAVERPALFEQAVLWAVQAHASRGINGNDVHHSLQALAEVLADQIPELIRKPALPIVEHVRARLEQPVVDPAPVLDEQSAHASVAMAYCDAVIAGRRDAALDVARDALGAGLDLKAVHEEVILPALREIGRQWHLGRLTIADEHAATAATEHVLAALRSELTLAAPNGRRVVTTSVPGEMHTVGIRMITDQLELAGWSTTFLGADVPVADLVHCVLDREAHLLAISATSPYSVRALGELIDALRRAPELASLKIMIGGRSLEPAPDLWRELGADGYATTVADAIEVAEQLVPAAGADA